MNWSSLATRGTYEHWPSGIRHGGVGGTTAAASELPLDVLEWTTTTMSKTASHQRYRNQEWMLRLEEWTDHDHTARKDAQSRNLQRMHLVATAPAGGSLLERVLKVHHLHLHFSVCQDPLQRQSLIGLLKSNENWKSITILGMHGMMDWYARPISADELEPLFQAFQKVQCLHLFSCPWFRGHGLDVLCKSLQDYTHLQEVRLQGWQWDRVAVDAWKLSLSNIPTIHRVRHLSLQSCTFQGDGVVQDMIECISRQFPKLRTLNMSCCSLSDDNVVFLVQQFQERKPSSLQHLHLGGNKCSNSTSVDAISQWLHHEQCSLVDLNLSGLWAAYSEDHGLLQRPVSLSRLYESLATNNALKRLCLAGNILDNSDISQLLSSLKLRSTPLSDLDVGDNPFSSEEGGRSLLEFISWHPTLHSLRFENPYLTYQAAPLIHFRIRFQWYLKRIQSAPSEPPLALWSNILCFFANHNQNNQGGTDGWTNPTTPQDLVYSFLQSTSGEYGHTLLYRVAKHYGRESRQDRESGIFVVCKG